MMGLSYRRVISNFFYSLNNKNPCPTKFLFPLNLESTLFGQQLRFSKHRCSLPSEFANNANSPGYAEFLKEKFT